MKRIIAALCALLLLLPAARAGAEDMPDPWAPENYGLRELETTFLTVDWKELGVKKNTTWPVYSAPFEDAWRPAKGKAKVSAAESFTLIGTAGSGQWSMIEYRIDKGTYRIGWARLPDVTSEFGDMLPGQAVLSRLTRDAELTDDPRGKRKTALKLKKGDTVIAFGTLDESWTYVETEVDGKTAWLFIRTDALTAEPVWHISADGKTLTVDDRVTRIGMPGSYSYELDEWVPLPIRRGDVGIETLDGEMFPETVENVVIPDSVKHMGDEAVVHGHYKSLRFPAIETGVKESPFYGVTIDTLTVSGNCKAFNPNGFDYSSVGAWAVEEGNPSYKAVDGVLFSADGKTLLAYPADRADTHYDVPAGTEEIGDRAFYASDMDIPLVTVSLPDGLKRIGEYAFCGCGRLLSLTVPLTVTELDEHAFSDCVSLERLSLPEGLKATWNADWTERPSFTFYNGDNGETQQEDRPEEWRTPNENYTECSFAARADTPDGTGSIPWYRDAESDEPAGELNAGTHIYVWGIRDGRACTSVWVDGEMLYRWYRLEDLQPETGNVFFTVDYVNFGDDTDYAGWTREDGGDRTLGVLYAGPGLPVRVLDAPEGTEKYHCYDGEQAEVSETNAGWLRIRTARGEGWVREAEFIPVPPAEKQ